MIIYAQSRYHENANRIKDGDFAINTGGVNIVLGERRDGFGGFLLSV